MWVGVLQSRVPGSRLAAGLLLSLTWVATWAPEAGKESRPLAGDIVADRLVDGTVHTVGEEHALGLWIAQEEDVQDLLGSPREGEAAHVRRDDVHPAVRHSDCARVSVH